MSDPSTDAVHGLYRVHAADVHAYASRRVGRDLADDVVAETFRRAIESYGSFRAERDSSGGRAWLFGIATNVLRRHWRTERRRLAALGRARPEPLASAGLDPLLSVPQRLDAVTDAARVLDAIPLLSPDDHALLMLVAWERMSSTEVAAVLGLAPGTVRSRLHRIRRELDSARRAPAALSPASNPDPLAPATGERA